MKEWNLKYSHFQTIIVITLIILINCQVSVSQSLITSNVTGRAVKKVPIIKETLTISIDQKVLLTEHQIELNNLQIKSPTVKDIKLESIMTKTNKGIEIDFKSLPKGNYYLIGNKDNELIAYKVIK